MKITLVVMKQLINTIFVTKKVVNVRNQGAITILRSPKHFT